MMDILSPTNLEVWLFLAVALVAVGLLALMVWYRKLRRARLSNWMIGCDLVIIAGANAGRRFRITDYDEGKDTLTWRKVDEPTN